MDPFVTTIILHDDVVPRLTPTSCRGLLKHLLHIRETWVKTLIEEDLRAVGERAKQVWAPRFRQHFTLTNSSKSIKKYCKKQIEKGKNKLLPVISTNDKEDYHVEEENSQSDVKEEDSFCSGQWGEKFGISLAPSFDSAMHTEEEDPLSNAEASPAPVAS